MYECVMGKKEPDSHKLFTGCLLADEMGLGMALFIAFLSLVKEISSCEDSPSHFSPLCV